MIATQLSPSDEPARPPADLLRTGAELGALLATTLERREWLDAFLYAAGLSQLVEDRLHPDPLLLRRTADYLGGRAAAFVGRAAAAADRIDRRRLDLAPTRHVLTGLCVHLAWHVVGRPGPEPPVWHPPAAIDLVADDIVRLPAGLHSFDQHPDDVRWLVHRFARQSDRSAVCVVGVRTSGSYLAPLHAAALATAGFADVEVLTYRPGRPFLPWERERLRATVQRRGQVLIVDDPPGSGSSVAATATAAMCAGVPERAIVLLLSLFTDEAGLPPALWHWRSVLQPWPVWSVHRRLADTPVAAGLASVLGPHWRVDGLHREAPATGDAREHLRARFAVRLTNRASGRSEQRDIVVEGAGLGYLGHHALDVARVLPEHLPRTYGVVDGLLYRDWLPTGPPADEAQVIDAAIDYVVQRARALPVEHDPVPQLRGRDPAWEVAAAQLARLYGRLAPIARLWPLEPIVRRLLTVASPCLVDGNTDRRHWRPDPSRSGRLAKVDFHQRAYSHLDLNCYDAAFDVAGLAADAPHAGFAAQARAAYAARADVAIDAERWLLYRLVQLWRLERLGDVDADRACRQAAAAVHDYLAGHYLRDLPPASGDLCAIDLDGVLETDALGYPATSPAGVLALRALIAHGYRPVLATGRNLDDARDRCDAFGLAGAVAEYGAVVYDHLDGTVVDLRTSAERELLDAVRTELGDAADPAYRYSIRARTDDGPLPAPMCPRQPGLRVVHGQRQTDIAVARLDKAAGLRALADRLGDAVLDFAVGDTAADLSMLAMARTSRAPRNAVPSLRRSVPATRHAYQAGLLDACADLLGHRPGRCPSCRPPRPDARGRVLLAVLSLRENGLRGLAGRTVRLGALSAGRSRW